MASKYSKHFKENKKQKKETLAETYKKMMEMAGELGFSTYDPPSNILDDDWADHADMVFEDPPDTKKKQPKIKLPKHTKEAK